jgi:hypothetical protein
VPSDNNEYVSKIRQSGLTIYEYDRSQYIPTCALEKILNEKLCGVSLEGLAPRTRSKIVKELICKALGYSVPKSFKKTPPRFPCQNFDVYNQKSNNLQIWNEPIVITRRYVIVKIAEDDKIQRIKVVHGDVLTNLDTTGTLTKKYQARIKGNYQQCELVSCKDTDNLLPHVASGSPPLNSCSPNATPTSGSILTVQTVYEKLTTIVGKRIAYHGAIQDRKRGDNLHCLVCQALGYKNYVDNGQFPDICHQLLEVKMQTAPTIDLGMILPTDESYLPFSHSSLPIRYCDVRYAVFYGEPSNKHIIVTKFYLVCGIDFFTRFVQFQGKVTNSKLQIPIPSDFFD